MRRPKTRARKASAAETRRDPRINAPPRETCSAPMSLTASHVSSAKGLYFRSVLRNWLVVPTHRTRDRAVSIYKNKLSDIFSSLQVLFKNTSIDLTLMCKLEIISPVFVKMYILFYYFCLFISQYSLVFISNQPEKQEDNRDLIRLLFFHTFFSN